MPANPHIGEAEFRGLKLRMDFDSFAKLETVSGKKMPRLCTEYEMGLGLSDLVQWFRCFTVGDVQPDQIKGAIHQGGMMADYAAANEVLGKMMNAFFSPATEGEVEENPQTAA